MHPAAKCQFERAVRGFAQWRAVPADERSPTPACRTACTVGSALQEPFLKGGAVLIRFLMAPDVSGVDW